MKNERREVAERNERIMKDGTWAKRKKKVKKREHMEVSKGHREKGRKAGRKVGRKYLVLLKSMQRVNQ